MCLRKFIEKSNYKGSFGCGVEAHLNRQTREQVRLSELSRVATKFRDTLDIGICQELQML